MLTYGIIAFIKTKKPKQNIDPEDPVELAKKNYFKLFVKGFFLNFINIGVLGFWLAIIITMGPKLETPSRMFTFFTAVIVSYFVTDIFKVLLAKQLRSSLNPLNIMRIKKGSCIVLMISGVFLLSQGWFPKDRKMMNNAIEKFENKD
jgi:threonine/homoserine/homoserine lactone efflux protein